MVGLSIIVSFTSCRDKAKNTVFESQPEIVFTPRPAEIRPLPGRPSANQLNPAQIEFWNYIEQFNHLPENPSETAIAIFNAKGIPPVFHYLETAKTSVLGNIAGLTAYRAVFLTRYPWVQPILDRYSIQLPISAERFSGTAKEIGKKYDDLAMVSYQSKKTAENEKIFVTNYLEGLLTVDYLYACGTLKDKEEAMKVVEGVFQLNSIIDPFHNTLEKGLLTPASRDIGWAAVADFPELIWGQTTGDIRSGFSEFGLAEKVNFGKWLLRTKGIQEMEDVNQQRAERLMIHNEQVKAGLLSYSIYSAHCQEVVRPPDEPGLTVVGILFKRLFPKDHVAQYQRYLTLLNAAYPKTKA